MKVPCKNCKSRYLGCHSKCDDYQEFCGYKNDLKDKKCKEKQLEWDIHCCIRRAGGKN